MKSFMMGQADFYKETTTDASIFYTIRLRYTALLLLLAIIYACNGNRENIQTLPFTVSVSVQDSVTYNHFFINCEQVKEYLGEVDFINSMLRIRDLNNDNILYPKLFDTNKDRKPDLIRVETMMQRNEPLKPFELIISKHNRKQNELIDSFVSNEGTIRVTLLQDYSDYIQQNNVEKIWAKTVVTTFMNTYSSPADLEMFEPGEWTYTNGFFLNALCYYYELTGDDSYISYVQQWLDLFLNDKGEIAINKYRKEKYRLDDILPGRSLLYVYKKTGDPKYLKAAGILVDQLKEQPRTSDGGYWHKKIYEWQMWLDGIYMADVFMLQYADIMNQPEYIDKAVSQIRLIYNHTRDSVTGLLVHGWDESRTRIWANTVNGKSPEVWGRGMGWYTMALVDALDYIPENHPGRAEVLHILSEVSGALINYQDKELGLWYQVIDKPQRNDNWPESSCTAMFAYSFLKAYKKGYLPERFKLSAEKAFNGLKQRFVYFDKEGKIYLTGTVKVGTLNEETSNGSYEYYVSVDRRVNDFKGIGALLYLAITDEYLNINNMTNNEK